MTIKPFKAKAKDEIRQEVITKYELNEEDNQDLIDKFTEDLYKAEEFKAAEKNKTLKAREEAKHLLERKEFYKQGGKLKGAKQEPEKFAKISSDDKAYLYSKMNLSRTEVRHLEKVMRATGKSWDKAMGDGLFKSWKKENDTLIKRQGSQLGASRGGGTHNKEISDMTKKFSQNLPKGFSAEKPKS